MESDSPLDIVFNADDSADEGQVSGDTNKYFLPPNLKSVRELVIDTQSKRKARVGSKFVERMEDNLVKWKPPLSSNRGTIMAVDGTHPYQKGTDNNGVVALERHPAKLFDSFTHWWKENARGILEARRQQFEEEFFSFTDFQDIDRVAEVTVAPTIPEEENYDDLYRQFISMDREEPLDMDAMFSSVSSISASSQGTFLAGPVVRTPPRIVLKRKRKKSGDEYTRSYSRPIPPAYLPQTLQQQSPTVPSSSLSPPLDMYLCNWFTTIKECIAI